MSFKVLMTDVVQYDDSHVLFIDPDGVESVELETPIDVATDGDGVKRHGSTYLNLKMKFKDGYAPTWR